MLLLSAGEPAEVVLELCPQGGQPHDRSLGAVYIRWQPMGASRSGHAPHRRVRLIRSRFQASMGSPGDGKFGVTAGAVRLSVVRLNPHTKTAVGTTDLTVPTQARRRTWRNAGHLSSPLSRSVAVSMESTGRRCTTRVDDHSRDAAPAPCEMTQVTRAAFHPAGNVNKTDRRMSCPGSSSIRLRRPLLVARTSSTSGHRASGQATAPGASGTSLRHATSILARSVGSNATTDTPQLTMTALTRNCGAVIPPPSPQSNCTEHRGM